MNITVRSIGTINWVADGLLLYESQCTASPEYKRELYSAAKLIYKFGVNKRNHIHFLFGTLMILILILKQLKDKENMNLRRARY